MNSNGQISKSQEQTFEELMRPESNWPNELRDKFEERCSSLNGYKRDLDREVVSDYIQEIYN